MTRWNRAGIAGAILMAAVLVAGCSGTPAPAAATPLVTASPTPTPVATPTPTASPTPTPVVVTPAPATGPAAIDAPADVPAGTNFTASWTGPNGQGDYITLVAVGTEKWTNEPYFYTSNGPSGTLYAPTTPGAYELWYVTGDPEVILFRRPITVKPAEATVGGPDSVGAGTTFKATWTGANGPGDYVTIVKAGVERWTNESYFYTSSGSPGDLIAPIEAGAYELWYVNGNERKTLARRPVTVTPLAVTLTAPNTVAVNSKFKVTWTGPDGPRDYITIVPAGSDVGAYASYEYTATGNPVELTAPAVPGNYEIRYASDREKGTFGTRPIIVR
jgi:Ca-activated chloride channel homolog